MKDRKYKLFCVDDEPLNIKLIAAIFPGPEYDVQSAQDGIQAWERIQSESFDLLFLDIMLPGMNGFELCKKIRENRSFSNIPIVLITSLNDEKFKLRGVEAGADDIFVKPVNKEMLKTRVESLIRLRLERDHFRMAYEAMAESVSRLEGVSRSADLGKADLLSSFEPLIISLISHAGDFPGKPQFIILGMGTTAEWQWILFENHFNEIIKRRLSLPLEKELKSVLKRKNQLIYAGDAGIIKQTGLDLFTSRLEAMPDMSVPVSNLVCYVGKKFGIFALNYPHLASNFEGLLIRNVAAAGQFLMFYFSQLQEHSLAVEHMISALLRSSENLEMGEKRHPDRVGEYCGIIARNLKLSEAFIQDIHLQARLHDVGNLLIPPVILHKAGQLNFDEWEIIRRHTSLGAYIIGENSRLTMARNIALTHHEHWDGSGYPNWLAENNIPIEGRIAIVGDRYDALRISRPYKKAMDHQTACRVILEGDDRINPKQFDPQVLQAFKENSAGFEEAFQKSVS